MSDYAKEIEPFFMNFIHVEDASVNLGRKNAERLAGQRWGWLVDDEACALRGGWEPSQGVEYMGIKATEQAAIDAAVGYIWKCRSDIVRWCKEELWETRRYQKRIAA